MRMIPIEWSSNQHRWALIRYYRNPSDSDLVSQHTTPREAVLRCQEWIQSDPWTYPEGDGILNHYYEVEARDNAGALDLAVERHRIAAEDFAAGRLSRFPRFDEPGGKLLQPGDDDDDSDEPLALPMPTTAELLRGLIHRLA